MKKKNPTAIRLQIQEPCDQSLDQMLPLLGGHHCDKCEKTVIDFTDMSDGEIVRIYEQRKGRVCGIFRNNQLNRNMALPMPIERNRNWKAVAAFAAALTFGNMASGQSTNHLNQAQKGEVIAQSVQTNKSNDFQFIKGKVTDENGEPLIGATVLIRPSEGTTTDIDGRFILKIPATASSQNLTVSYLGFQDQEMLWEKANENELQVILEMSATDLPDVVVTGYGTMHKQVVMGALAYFHEEESVMDTIGNEESEFEPQTPYVPTLEIFPNPFVSEIDVNIELQEPDAILFHLYNEAGQLLFAETHELPVGTQQIRLNLHRLDLTEGLYFLRISDSMGEVRTKRIVKVRP